MKKKVFTFLASAVTLFWIGYIIYIVTSNTSPLGRIFIVVWGVVLAIWYLGSRTE